MSDPYETVSLTVKQVQEALSSENLYYASQKLGYTPSTREALIHFIDQTYPPKNVKHILVSPIEAPDVFEPYPLPPHVCPECGMAGFCHHMH